jgi:hypothetical protein
MGGNLKPSEAPRLLRRFTPRNDIHCFNLDRELLPTFWRRENNLHQSSGLVELHYIVVVEQPIF